MNYPGFVGGAYTLQNISADCQRCVNLYPQQDESGGGKNHAILLSTPGLKRLVDVSGTATGGVRGSYSASNDRFFFVVGAYLFELSAANAILGTYLLPGEVSEGVQASGQISITDN